MLLFTANLKTLYMRVQTGSRAHPCRGNVDASWSSYRKLVLQGRPITYVPAYSWQHKSAHRHDGDAEED